MIFKALCILANILDKNCFVNLHKYRLFRSLFEAGTNDRFGGNNKLKNTDTHTHTHIYIYIYIYIVSIFILYCKYMVFLTSFTLTVTYFCFCSFVCRHSINLEPIHHFSSFKIMKQKLLQIVASSETSRKVRRLFKRITM